MSGEERDVATVGLARSNQVLLRAGGVVRNLVPRVGGVTGLEHSSCRRRAVDAVRHASGHLENLNFQGVAGCGVFDVDGARQNMSAPVLPALPRRPQIDHILQHLVWLDAHRSEKGHRILILECAPLRQGLDANPLSSLDGEDRRAVDWKPSQEDILGSRGHVQFARCVLSARRGPHRDEHRQ